MCLTRLFEPESQMHSSAMVLLARDHFRRMPNSEMRERGSDAESAVYATLKVLRIHRREMSLRSPCRTSLVLM